MDDFEWDKLPEYLIDGVPIENSFFNSRASKTVGEMMSDAVDRSAHSPHSLAVFLNTRAYSAKRANIRSRNWWGRFYNKCSGEHAYYIKLKGPHLIQVLKVAEKVPENVNIPYAANCALRLDVADRILSKLKNDLEKE